MKGPLNLHVAVPMGLKEIPRGEGVLEQSNALCVGVHHMP